MTSFPNHAATRRPSVASAASAASAAGPGGGVSGWAFPAWNPDERVVRYRARLASALRTLAVPALLLTLAASPRFHQVGAVGIRFDDEAAYAGDARLWHRCLRFLADGRVRAALWRGDAGAAADACRQYGIDPGLRHPKPCQGFTFLAAGMMFLAGDRPEALAALNAALGTATVLLVYAVGVRMLGGAAGLCAALVLAVWPYHVHYGRIGLADGAAVFFIVLGVWFWLLARRAEPPQRRRGLRFFVLAGLALGYAVTCHFRSAMIPVLLASFELAGLVRRSALVSRRSGLRAWLVRWALLALALAAPSLAIEAVFRAARYGAEALGFHLPLATFLEGWAYWARLSYEVDAGMVRTHLNLAAAWAFVEYQAHWHGPLAVAAVGAGAMMTLRRGGPSGAARLPAVVIFATLSLMLFQNHTVARAYAVLLPFAALCVGAAAQEAARRLTRVPGRATAWAAVLTCAVSVPAVRATAELVGQRSDIPLACAFLAGRSEPAVVPTLDKYALYLEAGGPAVMGADLFYRTYRGVDPGETLADLRRQGVRWLVTDPQYFHYRADDPIHRWWAAMIAHLGTYREAALRQTGQRPVLQHTGQRPVPQQTGQRTVPHLALELPHLRGFRWEFQAEGPGLHRLAAMTDAGAGEIRIYDLAVAGG